MAASDSDDELPDPRAAKRARHLQSCVGELATIHVFNYMESLFGLGCFNINGKMTPFDIPEMMQSRAQIPK